MSYPLGKLGVVTVSVGTNSMLGPMSQSLELTLTT